MTNEEIGKFLTLMSQTVGQSIEKDTPGNWRAVIVTASDTGVMIFGSAGITAAQLKDLLTEASKSANRGDEQYVDEKPH